MSEAGGRKVIANTGAALAFLALLLPSVILNAISFGEWTTDGKPNDVDDDNTPGRSWEAGLADWLGFGGPAVRKVLASLWAEPKRWRHHIKGLTKAWIADYPKRASKFGAVIILLHWLAIALLIWRPWA